MNRVFLSLLLIVVLTGASRAAATRPSTPESSPSSWRWRQPMTRLAGTAREILHRLSHPIRIEERDWTLDESLALAREVFESGDFDRLIENILPPIRTFLVSSVDRKGRLSPARLEAEVLMGNACLRNGQFPVAGTVFLGLAEKTAYLDNILRRRFKLIGRLLRLFSNRFLLFACQ